MKIMKKNKTHRMVHIAVLSALSVVLMFFDFPIPFFPPFLKLDASDAVVFASSVFVGPFGMVAIILLRSLLYWLLRGAELGVPVGALVTILSSATFCLVSFASWKSFRTFKSERKKILVSLGVGTMAMSVIMFIVNYFWVTPFYFAIAGWALPEQYTTYMLVYIPFNIIKGGMNALLVYALSPYLVHRTSFAPKEVKQTEV